MKLLIVSNFYPPHEVGGYEQLCRDIAVRLAARGHATHVITSNHVSAGQATPVEPNVHRRLRLSPDYTLRLAPWLQFFVQRRQAEAESIAILKTIIGEVQPDVIFIWNLELLPHTLAVEAESHPGIGVAYWLAGYSPAGPDLWWRYWAQAPNSRSFLAAPKAALGAPMLGILRAEGKPARPQLRHAGVVSEWQLKQGVAKGVLPPTARVIYNGVELEDFRRPVPPDAPGPLRLLIAGRVSPDKGIHVAVEAVGRLIRDEGVPGIELVIAGSGPERYQEQLEAIAAQYGIADRVQFLGWQPREQMPGIMAKCHVMVLPSIHPEAFARVVLEGMAAGLAAVGTDAGGTAEIIRHNETGLIVRPDDVADMTAQLKRLATEPGLRCRLAEAGQREVMDRFSIDRMVENIENLLVEAEADRIHDGGHTR